MSPWLFHAWSVILAAVEHANPLLLFLAVAVLPLVGFPASAIVIAVGVRLGVSAGLAFVMAAYLVNFTAGYWLARSWFRGPVGRWLERRRRRIPTLNPADETQFILLLRITPGLPLFVQTYMLGFVRVNFTRYLIFSLLIQLFYVYALLSFGQSLSHNAAWHAILAVALLIGLALAINLLRRRLSLRRASAPIPPS